jgi:hypothetical protein
MKTIQTQPALRIVRLCKSFRIAPTAWLCGSDDHRGSPWKMQSNQAAGLDGWNWEMECEVIDRQGRNRVYF